MLGMHYLKVDINQKVEYAFIKVFSHKYINYNSCW